MVDKGDSEKGKNGSGFYVFFFFCNLKMDKRNKDNDVFSVNNWLLFLSFFCSEII